MTKIYEGDLRNVILIGFMAAGKSSVGRLLARELDWTYLDTDSEIELISGSKIQDMFLKYGEARFRSEERLVVKKIEGVSRTVVSTGGGTVLDPGNWEILQKMGIIIHLYAPLDVALQRVKRRQERPLLSRSHDELEALWLERLPIYNQAHVTIDTSEKTINELAEEILVLVKGGCMNNETEN